MKFPIILIFMVCLVVLPFLLPNPGFPQETLRFARMWPALQQPWHFNHPQDVASDDAGHIYVADTENHSIQKFTSEGQLINRWAGPKGGDKNVKHNPS